MTLAPALVSVANFQNAVIFEYDDNEDIASVDETCYAGIPITGVKSLEVTSPAVQTVVNRGDGGIISVDYMASAEAYALKLTVGMLNHTLDQAITGVKSRGVSPTANMRHQSLGTDRQGLEKQVGLLAYQQALSTDKSVSSPYGPRYWNSLWIPRCILVPSQPGMTGMSADPGEVVYDVVPMVTNRHLWGEYMTLSADGHLLAQLGRAISKYKPVFCSFKGDGVATVFPFPTAWPAAAATSEWVSVYENGVLATTGFTVSTTAITYSPTPPTAGKQINVVLQSKGLS